MLQVYFRKNKLQSKKFQTAPKYQFRCKSFKKERDKLENLKLCFKLQLWQYVLTKCWIDLIYKC